jgi:hypothetical protein
VRLLRIFVLSVLAGTTFTSSSGALTVEAVGVKAGVAYSQVDLANSTYGRSEWHTGVTAGPFVTIALGRGFSFQPNLIYVRRGGAYHDRAEHPDGSQAEVREATFRLDHLELPLLLRYTLMPDRRLSPVVSIGPTWGRVLASEYAQDGTIYPDMLGESDTALTIGIGVATTAGDSALSLEVLYRRAHSGIGKELGEEKTDGISILVGAGF